MRITTIIIDDDADSRLIIRDYIETHFPEIIVTGEGGSIAEASKLFQKQAPDLVLLDISLPDGTAFEWLQTIAEKHFEIIFITAYNSYAIEAFRFAAIDYLLKPIAFSNLDEALRRTTQRMEEKYFSRHWSALSHNMQHQAATDRKLAIATGNGYLFSDLKEIVRMESQGNYTNFYFASGKKLVSAHTLGYYEELLPPDIFMRIHHSHIINTSYVARYSKEGIGGTIFLTDGTSLGVSQRKKEFVIKKLIRNQ